MSRVLADTQYFLDRSPNTFLIDYFLTVFFSRICSGTGAFMQGTEYSWYFLQQGLLLHLNKLLMTYLEINKKTYPNLNPTCLTQDPALFLVRPRNQFEADQSTGLEPVPTQPGIGTLEPIPFETQVRSHLKCVLIFMLELL
jgi:hypothetical protein